MERDNFDTELFIDENEKRVAIWDMESSDYSNRITKRRNWEEIVEIFCEAGDSEEKKKTLAEEQDFSGDGEDVMRPPRSQAEKKKKLNAADEEFLSIIKTNLASGNQPQTSNQMESDDDKLFCLSLHKELLKVPEEN
ncbi:hypothetical protein JTB14_024484 [Gonioctena quinquepunctata]|nr:hypothetical protein JTB14_024484 [Gonioctena quinquepunctata]